MWYNTCRINKFRVFSAESQPFFRNNRWKFPFISYKACKYISINQSILYQLVPLDGVHMIHLITYKYHCQTLHYVNSMAMVIFWIGQHQRTNNMHRYLSLILIQLCYEKKLFLSLATVDRYWCKRNAWRLYNSEVRGSCVHLKQSCRRGRQTGVEWSQIHYRLKNKAAQ